MKTTSDRSKTINIRISEPQRDLIDKAAATLGKSRSEFLLETACAEAEHVLLDQVYFQLDDDKFEQFVRLVDDPPPVSDALRRTLNRTPPWE